MVILWLGSFLMLYDISINSMLNNNSLIGMWEGAFMPTDKGIGKGLLWIGASLLDMFKSTLGLTITSLALGIFFFGCYSMFKRNQTRFFYLILPVIVTLVMAILGKYPFSGRLILFISPCLALMIGEGVVFISGKIPRYTSIISVILITSLFYSPVLAAGQKFVKGHSREEMRPVMEYFSNHYRDGDFIYMSNSAQYAFGYYHGQFDFGYKPVDIGKIVDLKGYDGEVFGIIIMYGRYFFTKQGYFIGLKETKKKNFEVDIYFKDGLKGFRKENRSWFILSHMRKNQKDGLLAFLDNNATKLQEYKAIGSSIYLYDLSGSSK